MTKPKRPTADEALAHIRSVLTDGKEIERPYLEKLVAGYAKQQAALQRWDEKAAELADEETHALVLLASGALSRSALSGKMAAQLARDALTAIRCDVASRERK